MSQIPLKARWLILVIALIVAIGAFFRVLVGLLEFLVGVAVPVAGGSVLVWFAYKLLLQPVLRQRKLEKIREQRARRAAERH